MVGVRPLSVVVVCEPITVQVNIVLSLEHWSWYSLITPFGVAGALQVIFSDVELSAIKKN